MDFGSTHSKHLIMVWHHAIQGARKFCLENKFVQVHGAPELVGISGACENVSTLFPVDFFGKKAYLTQSDQLYLETLTPSLGRCWAEIQSFRAEPEADPRHLAQFSLFEIEHQGDFNLLLNNVEGIVKSMAAEVAANCQEELAFFKRSPEELLAQVSDIKRVTYTDAIEMLKPFFPDLHWGDDLKANHEAKMTDLVGACFLTLFPLDIKFFNMRQSEDNPSVVNSADLLLPWSGESSGSAEREHEYERVVNRLKSSTMYKTLIALGGSDVDFEWYLNFHKNREIPLHSGAGIGVNRVIQFILGQEDIRTVTPFVVNRECLL